MIIFRILLKSKSKLITRLCQIEETKALFCSYKTETIKVICYLEKVARNKKFIILKSMFELNISIAVTPAPSSFCPTV